jgi:hypothetical protein
LLHAANWADRHVSFAPTPITCPQISKWRLRLDSLNNFLFILASDNSHAVNWGNDRTMMIQFKSIFVDLHENLKSEKPITNLGRVGK